MSDTEIFNAYQAVHEIRRKGRKYAILTYLAIFFMISLASLGAAILWLMVGWIFIFPLAFVYFQVLGNAKVVYIDNEAILVSHLTNLLPPITRGTRAQRDPQGNYWIEPQEDQ